MLLTVEDRLGGSLGDTGALRGITSVRSGLKYRAQSTERRCAWLRPGPAVDRLRQAVWSFSDRVPHRGRVPLPHAPARAGECLERKRRRQPCGRLLTTPNVVPQSTNRTAPAGSRESAPVRFRPRPIRPARSPPASWAQTATRAPGNRRTPLVKEARFHRRRKETAFSSEETRTGVDR
jgi:hypothetical protein